MARARSIPCALTIAGSDSGGGAGIQADLKTFAALGVHGTSVITCLTAQNPRRVSGLLPISPAFVRKQLDAVFAELPPVALKIGLVHSAGVARTLAQFFQGRNGQRLVIDPVMISTSLAHLLKPAALRTMMSDLFPLASILTPNLDEAERLVEMQIREVEDLRDAARRIHSRFGCAALVKGGHLRGPVCVDVYFDGTRELILRAPCVHGISTHGTGCTLSAAITAELCHGYSLPKAVQRAKRFVTSAIRKSQRVGRHWVLNPFFLRSEPG